jgi:hypothetical protein
MVTFLLQEKERIRVALRMIGEFTIVSAGVAIERQASGLDAMRVRPEGLVENQGMCFNINEHADACGGNEQKQP